MWITEEDLKRVHWQMFSITVGHFLLAAVAGALIVFKMTDRSEIDWFLLPMGAGAWGTCVGWLFTVILRDSLFKRRATPAILLVSTINISLIILLVL